MADLDVMIAVSAGLGAFGATLVTELIGSFVRRSQSGEKSRDDDVTEIIGTLVVLRDLADAYWTKSAVELGEQEAVLRARIGGAVHHINLLVASLFTGKPKRECDTEYVQFMHAIAGDTFGDPDRAADPDRLMLVHQTALQFRHRVVIERRHLPRKWLA